MSGGPSGLGLGSLFGEKDQHNRGCLSGVGLGMAREGQGHFVLDK